MKAFNKNDFSINITDMNGNSWGERLDLELLRDGIIELSQEVERLGKENEELRIEFNDYKNKN